MNVHKQVAWPECVDIVTSGTSSRRHRTNIHQASGYRHGTECAVRARIVGHIIAGRLHCRHCSTAYTVVRVCLGDWCAGADSGRRVTVTALGIMPSPQLRIEQVWLRQTVSSLLQCSNNSSHTTCPCQLVRRLCDMYSTACTCRHCMSHCTSSIQTRCSHSSLQQHMYSVSQR